MAKQLIEDELNIRRKQRRRLIGAIALTLAVVVILPMVLDSEPRPSEPDIDLRIPDPDNAGEFVTSVEIPEKSTLPPPESASNTNSNEVIEPASGDAAKPTTTVPAQKTSVVAPAKTQTSSQANKSKAAEKPATTTGDAFVAQVGAYSNSDAAKQELSRLKKWGFKAYTEKAGGMIRVRVGPYPSREKAEKVGQMLEKHGLKPVILSAK